MKRNEQPIRINLLLKLDDLLEVCKSCEKRKQTNNSVSPEVVCKGCQTYSEIREIGENLGRKKQMAEITQEKYMDLKAKGLTDANIAKGLGMNPATLSYHKKKWATDTQEPVEERVKPLENKPNQEDKTAELLRLTVALKEAKDQAEQYKALYMQKEAKIEELQDIHAACEDVENELACLREENARLVKQGHHNSYIINNQKYQLEKWAMENEALEEENKALKYFARKYLA
jgi:hypothetical protein